MILTINGANRSVSVTETVFSVRYELTILLFCADTTVWCLPEVCA